ALNGNNACYLAFVRSANQLHLVNDPGTALLSPMTLNGNGHLRLHRSLQQRVRELLQQACSPIMSSGFYGRIANSSRPDYQTMKQVGSKLLGSLSRALAATANTRSAVQ